jgi:uncharacterized membrane protein YedE/YeeE
MSRSTCHAYCWSALCFPDREAVMTEFSPGNALVGGVLIGLSASLAWAFNGKVAGISGIVAGLVTPSAARDERSLRAFFVLGLLLGGVALLALRPELLPGSGRPLSLLLGAGALVGVGTHLSNGCTSGHGVCGIARGAPRSLLATLTFLITGALSALLVRVLLGLAS